MTVSANQSGSRWKRAKPNPATRDVRSILISNLSFGSCFNILFAFLIEQLNSVLNLRLLFLYFLYDPFLMPPSRLNPLKVGLESPSELSSASYKSSVVEVSIIRVLASGLFTGTFLMISADFKGFSISPLTRALRYSDCNWPRL